MLKKLKFLLCLGGMCIGLCGCVIKIGPFVFLGDDDAAAKKHVEEIVAALDDQDSDKLLSLFTNGVKNDVETLDEDVKAVVGYYKGKMKSLDYSRTNSQEDLAHGKKRKTISCSATIHTNKEDYTLLLDYVIKNTMEKGDVGIYFLSIVKTGEEDQYAYPEYVKGEGIFAPVLYDEEEIENRKQAVYNKHPEFFDEHPEALEHFRIFEEYPEFIEEKPTVFDKYPSLLENLDECDQTPWLIKYYPDHFEEDEEDEEE